ncbi:preprotein translocase subunit SecG [Neobittarella massiliensis]|uniref:Protein-export membrane protein SecG n=2 Tax=Oscillospiraceae TaxID=216572 RepID=A0A8J6LZB3_9FIRM|nr:preprotein translocase subunit SecG [Neobittarella massiliensis]MBC3516513.1 preprotein translocase subunit SecG [Neobittarella massiliensis]SCJ90748.1 preprotein translocase subunit SecG [uncultured Anaerotruncus sp.]
MNTVQIVAGVLLLISCLVIILMVIMQEPTSGMSNTISGGSAQSYLGSSGGRTPDALLAKWTKIAGVAFFALTLLVGVFGIFSK